MGDMANCPNCGAVVHDCVCEYCGTVFPSSLSSFCGKPCVLVTIRDGNLFAMALDVHAIERNPQTDYFTDNMELICVNRSNEVTVTGTLGDTQALFRIAHDIKKRLEDA